MSQSAQLDARRRAEAGVAAAMYKLGCQYDWGRDDLCTDKTTAFLWYSRGSETTRGTDGQVNCATKAGMMLLGGHGVQRNEVYGISLLTEAACDGSILAKSDLAVHLKRNA